VTYPPPPVPDFPAGYGPYATDFDSWVQAPFGFLTNNVVFRAERHASQTLTASTNVTIEYDTILEDPFGGWNATSYWWLAPYTGWYLVTLTATCSVVSGIIEALIGTPETLQRGSLTSMNSSVFGGASASQVVPLTGGYDYVYGCTNVNASTTTNTVDGRYSTMEITYVSE
jgi:hypothetical protein